MTDPTRQPSLDRLIARLSSLIGAATDALQADMSRADEWYNEVARQLRRYSLAANLNGQGGGGAQVQRAVVDEYVKTQLEYLAKFRDEVKAADEWKPGWNSRAQMYAESIRAPWWSGATRGWPLPAMPADGSTQCLTRCRCSWRIDELDGDGNANAYWQRGAGDSCQTCIEREQQWNPLQVRNGELQ